MNRTQLAWMRMTPRERRAERWAQYGRKLARQACPELNRNDAVPVAVVEGDVPPHVEGEFHYWTSKRTGQRVTDGRAYWRGGGWPVYHYSTRVVVVGRDWLLPRLVAAIDKER
jgi:hypothetical protein